MRMFKSRRGFVYLLIASFAIAVILLVFLSSNAYHYQDQESLYQVRIRAMNDFVKNFNSDVHRATYIAAFRSLVALEDYTAAKGVFLNNTNEYFRKTFFYGTIDGNETTLLENSSFEDYLSRVKELANSIGIILNVNITHIELTQSTPWSIDVHVFADINMTDTKGLASWIYSQEYVTTLPIFDLRDPLYGVNTMNKVPNTIRINATDLVVNNNTDNLIIHVNGSYYRASSNAPNFLMRFEGNNSADINGIESIVNVKVLFDQGVTKYDDRVKIDYLYFNNTPINASIERICTITQVPSYYHLLIPNNSFALYNLSGLYNPTNCT